MHTLILILISHTLMRRRHFRGHHLVNYKMLLTKFLLWMNLKNFIKNFMVFKIHRVLWLREVSSLNFSLSISHRRSKIPCKIYEEVWTVWTVYDRSGGSLNIHAFHTHIKREKMQRIHIHLENLINL